MLYNAISLNGDWRMDYSAQEYTDRVLPSVNGGLVCGAVPGYFEDMTEKFKGTSFFESLLINPEYKSYEYPMTGYPPDMLLPNYLGTFFYEREFTVSDISSATIYFEGVQNSASVWLNGEFLYHHEGYSAPFEVDVPSGLLRLGENKITIAVSNHDIYGFDSQIVSGITSRAASRRSGGVTGDVEVRLYKSPLRDAAILISEDCSAVSVSLDATEDVVVDWRVLDGEKLIKEGKGKEKFTFDTENMALWSPELPKLYTLELSYMGASLERRFGIRRLLPDDAHYRLNGEPYYLRGICEHCYYPETVHPTHDKAFYLGVITKLKELGFNYIRFHTHVPPKEYLEAADELGMLMHVESPNNTSLAEWDYIVDYCRKYTSVVIYCTGNELQIDDLMVEHLRAVSEIVHRETDALFSPMSAMRGVEYGKIEEEQTVLTPFRHNPRRFNMISEFADMYSSYSIEHFSYRSTDADPELVSSWHEVYKKPRVTHEICIDGCFADISLKKRYEGTRIGETALFSSVERHLADKGVLDKAPMYFENSSKWQSILRKYCFEATRRCENMAGYDFLGPIDTHWHTFGYDVGMMNEFYEMKPGESLENVLRYNSPTVLLTDLAKKRNFASGEAIKCNILASCFGLKVTTGDLSVCIKSGEDKIYEKNVKVNLENGRIETLLALDYSLPEVSEPKKLELCAALECAGETISNSWEIYLFPTSNIDASAAYSQISEADLMQAIDEGRDVVILGTSPFKTLPTSFRMSLAGRTSGYCATVIYPHSLLGEFVHDGFCGWQFSSMLEGGAAVVFPDDVPFEPIIEVVTTHKNFVRESALFEIRCEKSRIIVCSLKLDENDPAATWLKGRILDYSKKPCDSAVEFTREQLLALTHATTNVGETNTNLAVNQNDITATKKTKK